MTAAAPPLPRFDQGFLALGLICGFVFQAPWVIPLAAVMAAASAGRPGLSPVPRVMTALLLRRPGRPPYLGYPAPWRTAAALDAAALAVGTLVLAVGDRGAAWAFGLPTAALAALASVGGVCVGCQIRLRRTPRG